MTDKELALRIYNIVGPAENITKAYNCMTRLRLHVVDEHFSADEVKKLPGVLGINKSGSEWQIVLGPGKAAKVTKEFTSLLADGHKEKPADFIGRGDALHEAVCKKNTPPAKLILKKIASVFAPIIPAFIACGLLTGIVNIAVKADPAAASLPICRMALIIGSAVFLGLHIFVGINAMKEFGGSPVLGGILAVIMNHPDLESLAIGSIHFVPGQGGIVAILLIAAFAAAVERKLHAVIPDMFGLFLTPLLTVLISTAAALGICQPLGGYISAAVGTAATEAIRTGGAAAGFILGGLFLPMVMTGVHQGLTPIHAELLSRYGVTILLPILAMAGGGQVGASLAVYAKTKNPALRKTIISALPVGIMGVGEPLIYGVTLPLGKPFAGACIGGACGGAVQAYYMVGSSALGISGLPLAAATDHIVPYLLGLAAAYSGGFAAAWFLGFDDPKP